MWVFSKLRNDETRTDDPTNKLFEGLGDVEALLREALQNSIDAKSSQNNSGPVVVKIGLNEVIFDEKSWMLASHGEIGGLNDHFDEARSQRNTNYPERLVGTNTCLTIEDFNTSGLCGPFDKKSKSKGSLIRYWWENNISDKEGSSGGSHGLGKETYNLASHSRTVYVLTSREDDEDELLLGFARPGRHDHKDQEYKDYVRFGCVDGEGEDPQINPYSLNLRNSKDIEGKFSEFRQFFSLERKKNQSGTSFVITNVSEKFNKKEILKSLLKNFYLPILGGEIEVHLQIGDSDECSLSKDTIADVADRVLEGDIRISFVEELEICRELLEPKGFFSQSTDVEFSKSEGLSDRSFSPSNLEDMRRDFLEKNAVKLALFLPVNPVGGGVENGRVEIIVQRRTKKDLEAFSSVFRGNINILSQGIKYKRVIKDFNVILNIPPTMRVNREWRTNPLSDFLRYCEDPGHVKWFASPNRRNEKQRYSRTWQREFVVGLPIALIRILKDEQSKKVHNFLDDIFSILKPNNLGSHVIEQEVSEDPASPSTPPVLPEKFDLFTIAQDIEKVGFRVSASKEFSDNFNYLENKDLEVKISVGYAGLFINKATAISNSRREIELKDDYEIELNGAQVVRGVANSVWLHIFARDFYVCFKGFDRNRDLIIDIDDGRLVNDLAKLKKEVA